MSLFTELDIKNTENRPSNSEISGLNFWENSKSSDQAHLISATNIDFSEKTQNILDSHNFVW